MKKFIKHLCLSVIILALSVAAGCSGQKQEPAKDQAKPEQAQQQAKAVNLKLATGNTGSAIYALGGGLAQVIEKYVPGTKVTVVGSAGYGENAVLIATKQADIGTTSGSTAQIAFKQKPELMETLRYLATTHQTLQHTVVAANSSIKKYEDLKGKKVSVGEAGSGTESTSRQLLKVYNLDYNLVKAQYLSFNESVEALQNGTVDAIMLTTMYPNPGILSLATQKDVRLLPMDAEAVKKLSQFIPGFIHSKIPAGTYKGINEDTYTAGAPAPYIVHKDMSEDMAYKITKSLIEHADEVAKVHPAAKQWTLDNALLGIDFPYHPGAKKYYQEIKAWDKRAEGAK